MWFLPSGDTFCLENMPNVASGLASLGMNRKSYQSNAMDRASNHSLVGKDCPRQPDDSVWGSRGRESGWVFLLQDRQESIPWFWGGPHGEPHPFPEPVMCPPPKLQVQPAMTITQEATQPFYQTLKVEENQMQMGICSQGYSNSLTSGPNRWQAS